MRDKENRHARSIGKQKQHSYLYSIGLYWCNFGIPFEIGHLWPPLAAFTVEHASLLSIVTDSTQQGGERHLVGNIQLEKEFNHRKYSTTAFENGIGRPLWSCGSFDHENENLRWGIGGVQEQLWVYQDLVGWVRWPASCPFFELVRLSFSFLGLILR